MISNKLVFFDVDGTLLNDQKQINESTIKAIEVLKEKNFIFCLATGRSFSNGIIELAKLAGLNGYLVLANGNYVWDIKNEVLTILGLPLEKEIVEKFYDICKKIKRQLNISFLDGSSKHYYFGDDINEIKDPRFFMFGPTIYHFENNDTIEQDLQKEILHISIKAETDIIKKIDKEFDSIRANKNAQISNVSNIYIEADSFGMSKWNGCQYIQSKLDISNENTYAFGDSENDLIILNNVGNPVCMGNASEIVKTSGFTIIGDNNSNAISKYLLNLIKDEK